MASNQTLVRLATLGVVPVAVGASQLALMAPASAAQPVSPAAQKVLVAHAADVAVVAAEPDQWCEGWQNMWYECCWGNGWGESNCGGGWLEAPPPPRAPEADALAPTTLRELAHSV